MQTVNAEALHRRPAGIEHIDGLCLKGQGRTRLVMTQRTETFSGVDRVLP